MALTKVTKHIVHGSLLVQFKYADLSDTSITSNTQTYQVVGSAITMTPQYGDSILECTFSASYEHDQTGSDSQYAISLFVNGIEEYEHTQLGGGPTGGNSFTQHGGEHDRVYSNIFHSSFRDTKQSVGWVHNHTPGNTNAQVVDVRGRSMDNNGWQLYVREGFLIVKELSMGVNSGSQN